MARVIYGFLGAALAALIAGFFIKHSSLPLYISMSFSVAAMALWTAGSLRRARAEISGSSDAVDVEELDAEEIEAVKAKAPAPDETLAIESIDDEEFAPPKPKPSRPRPSKSAPPKPKPAKPKPVVKRKPTVKRKPAAKRVAVVPGAERYHKPTCRFAQSPEIRMVSEAIAIGRGYVPCGVCKP